MSIIEATQLSKSYRTASKQPGLLGTLRHFFKRQYRDIHAVKGITFTIEPGQIVGFLGPNGAGKTTALKMLTGLIHPTSGSLSVAGHKPYGRSSAFLKKITLVMGQKQQLIWDLPVLDSLRINAAVYDIAPADFKQRLEELAAMLTLDTQLTQPVRKLSLGERMKCELLAALLHHPEILFLDEPTLGLDVNAQSAVREFLREYNRKFGATIMLTSHYMADITALCRRVLVIHQGNLIYDGSLEGIVEKFTPYRQITAEFAEPVNREALTAYGEVESVEGRVGRLIVERGELTRIVGRLLGEMQVVDLTVGDPPIEETIGRIFTQEAKA